MRYRPFRTRCRVELIDRPKVRMRASGVFYVDAAELLNSEVGLREIRKAAAHTAAIRAANRVRMQPAHDAVV